jgi:ATP-binding cassette, subfamily A (ABC1), member 3
VTLHWLPPSSHGLSVVCAQASVLTHILQEKEKKIKETMAMMGLRLTTYWLAWFITFLTKLGFISVLATVVCRYAGIFRSTPVSVLFPFFLSFRYARSARS